MLALTLQQRAMTTLPTLLLASGAHLGDVAAAAVAAAVADAGEAVHLQKRQRME